MIKIAKKRKLNLLLAISGILFFILLPGVNANYTENIVIDGSLDSEYSLISQTDNYSLYFANSNDYNYVFVSTNFNLTNRTINFSSGEFNYDISPEEVEFEFLHSIHSNDTLEIGISRASIGDTFEIIIEGLGFSILIIDPSSAPVESDDDDDDDEKDKDEKNDEVVNETINPFGSFANWWDEWITPNAWWLWIPTALTLAAFITFISRYIDKPILYIRKNSTKKFEDLKVGRMVLCKQAAKPLSQYWEYIFKSNGGIKKVFCRFNYSTLERWIETSKMPPFEKYMGHIIPITVKLPLVLQPGLRIRRTKVKRKHFVEKFGEYRRDILNNLAYVFYRFICIFIPSGWVGYGAHSLVKYVDAKDELGNLIKQEEITVLIHEATLKHITTVRKVKYKFRDYSTGKEVIKEETRKLALFQIEELKKNPNFVKIEKKGKYKTRVQNYDDPAEAMQVIASKAELQSIHDLDMQEIMNRLEKVEYDLLRANTIITNLKADRYNLIEKTMTAKENESILTEKTLINILARSSGMRELTGKPLEAMQEAVKIVLRENGSDELYKLKSELAKKTQQVEILKENLNDLRDHYKNNGSGTKTFAIQPLTDNLGVK